MKKIFKSILLILLSISSYAQQSLSEKYVIGDWKATDGKYFAQVYLSKEGTYKVNLTSDLISRAAPLAILTSDINISNSINISGDGWSGQIQNNKLSITKGTEKIEMKPFYRTSPTLNAKPPKDAIVLFNGKNLDAWTKVLEKDWLVGGAPADNFKILPDGILEVVPHEAGFYESIITKQKFGDIKLHLEFRLLGGTTNGGVYLQSRYELNIKDAYGEPGVTPIGFGNIANPKDLYPDVNVAFPPMQWQTFDIDFRAPRFDATGTQKIENARITVIHNGVTIYKDVEIIEVKGSTARLGEAGVGPLYLQDHGSAYQFRNIWLIDKTLKGTENYKTSSVETSTEKLKGSISTEGGKKAGGNKSGGKNGGGRKNGSNSGTITVEKQGGNKKTSNQNDTELMESQPVKKKGSSNKKVDATYDGEKNPAYASVNVSLKNETTLTPVSSSEFKHPGVLVNLEQLNEIKRRINAGIEPQKTAFEALRNSKYAALDYTPQAYDTVSCGPFSNPNIGCKDEQDDVIAAYSQALLWVITGNKIYAENSIKIMNEWSHNLVGGHNYANGPIQAAWCGSVWPRAAEIIRYTYNGWKETDILKFQNMLRTQYLPSIIHGNCENGNKELAMSEALINIGVFNDDKAVFDLGVKMWRGRTPAYIYLKSDGPTPVEPPGCGMAIWSNKGLMPELVDGILQETARDTHHAWMGFASIVNAAETAYIQGVDLYAEEGKRIMAAMEYQAQYLKPNNVPPPANLAFALNPTWEIAFNHYQNRKGYNLPKMKLVIPTNRPTGTNHHIIWETLTHGDMGNTGFEK